MASLQIWFALQLLARQLSAAPLLSPPQSRQGTVCVMNHRDEALRAWWSSSEYDALPPKQRSCFSVVFPASYRFTLPDGRLVLNAVLNSDEEINFDACEPLIECSGHGKCSKGSCECYHGALEGHWTGRQCNHCDRWWFGAACNEYCHINGVLDEGEECDDGNTIDNDGCTDCRVDTVLKSLRVNLYLVVPLVLIVAFLTWFVFCTEGYSRRAFAAAKAQQSRLSL
eukprot:TRINITY_DN26300_c0_g1_i1.p1 TRINITY_DN26300_c0_g1~~TRINITY_DN26300_c0_g1_i1.p1  ORF type:complete len:226 (-),score=17.26 TRINITY_DN26300_c0_g1_i1:26-703(-)